MKKYLVSFDVLANKRQYSFVQYVEANNMKEARTITENAWHNELGHKNHMFHINVYKDDNGPSAILYIPDSWEERWSTEERMRHKWFGCHSIR